MEVKGVIGVKEVKDKCLVEWETKSVQCKNLRLPGFFTFLLFYPFTFIYWFYEQRKAVRGTTFLCFLSVERLFQLCVTVTCSLAKLLLYADKLVVLGHTVGAAH